MLDWVQHLLLLCTNKKYGMSFIEIYIQAFFVIIILMSIIWVISVFLKNASIVDSFWGFGFVVVGFFYFIKSSEYFEPRKIIVLVLLIIWGLRLSFYIGWRNFGKGEDYRYKKFRKDYGEHRYWWISFFQVFVLQGFLLWLISAPLLAVQYSNLNPKLYFIDLVALMFWLIGFVFEAGGDFQMLRFKANPENKGKILNKGFWKYTRHPNYFGDASVWWGFGLFSIAAGSYLPFLSSLLMTLLLLKVSGVALLEKSLKENKPLYKEYIEKTSSFLPWFQKK